MCLCLLCVERDRERGGREGEREEGNGIERGKAFFRVCILLHIRV